LCLTNNTLWCILTMHSGHCVRPLTEQKGSDLFCSYYPCRKDITC
jgi:hypothetical protein